MRLKPIPEKMKVLELSAYHADPKEALQNLKIAERPVPQPGTGQVLVKIQGAPCNPSDLLSLTGTYNVVKPLPCVPGFEGFGTIVKKGSGFFPWLKIGGRIACGGQSDREGTWAEYFLAEAGSCLPLKKEVPDEQAPFMLVNPLTAMALVEVAKEKGAATIVQSAAASQLGQMVVKFAALQGIQTLNIVRRKEQVQNLKGIGAQHILNSSDEDFPAQLKSLSTELKATVALDAVSGNFTQHLLEQLPDGTHILLYGTLGGPYMDGLYSRAFSFGQKTK